MRRAQDRARSATIKSRALGALKLAREARDENVPAKRADSFFLRNYYSKKINSKNPVIFSQVVKVLT